jgi:hypothetical protein
LFKKYAVPLNLEEYRPIRPERSSQPTAVAVMQSRRFTRLGILEEMVSLDL